MSYGENPEARAVIGANVRRLRLQAGLTQARLARELDVSRSLIGVAEAGRKGFRAERMPTMARLFGCRVSDFFEGLEVSDGD